VLVDWVTARVLLQLLQDEDRAKLGQLGDRVRRFNAATGEIVYECQAWDSIRSDSHHLTYRVSGDALWMQGSPARVIGDGDAVFGAGPARALDLVGCVERMREVLAAVLAVQLPAAVPDWTVSRVDITGNLLLRSLADVRAGLTMLRNCEGGRYRVSQQAGDTVYWSHRSRYKSGKAYAKGPHLAQLMRRKDYDGRRYSEDEIDSASRLLRPELSLRSHYWRRQAGKPWYEKVPSELKAEWQAYFGRMLGDAEVTEMNIEERVKQVAESDGRAKAAIGCWALIKAYGWEKAREMSGKRTWYYNLKVLRAAGLSDADLSAGNVVPIRRPLIECRQVDSWEELRALCGRRAA
jgi:hypothetical protein